MNEGAERIADIIYRKTERRGGFQLSREELTQIIISVTEGEQGVPVWDYRVTGEQAAGEQTCECGHPKGAHQRFSDHDECTELECECDQFRPAPATTKQVGDSPWRGAERAVLAGQIVKELCEALGKESKSRNDLLSIVKRILSQRHPPPATAGKLWASPDSAEIDESEGFKKALCLAVDFAEWGWTIIANANGGNWETASEDWQKAAAKYRDDFHNEIRFLAGVPQSERGDSATARREWTPEWLRKKIENMLPDEALAVVCAAHNATLPSSSTEEKK